MRKGGAYLDGAKLVSGGSIYGLQPLGQRSASHLLLQVTKVVALAALVVALALVLWR